jgi:hypothetical protein
MIVARRTLCPVLAVLGLASCDPSPFQGVDAPTQRDADVRDADTRPGEPRGDGGMGPAAERDSGLEQNQTRPDAGTAEAGRGEQRDGGEGSAGTQAGAAGAAGESGEQAGASGSAGAPAEVCQRSDTDAAVRARMVHEPVTVASPGAIALRIPGPISWIGGKLTWLFPKSIRAMNGAGADTAPNQPHAAFVDRANPTQLDEDLEPDGVPRRFLTGDDANPVTELWPTALVRVPPPSDQETATGLAFVRTSSDLVTYDVHIGRVARNSTAAQEPLAPLFTGTDAKFSTGAHRGSEYAYLFACTENEALADDDPLRFGCKIGRAKLAELERHDSYRVYDPEQDSWLEDLSAGAPVVYGAASLLSLSYNNYLGRYLLVHSRWFSNDVIVHTAPSPWGPWREDLAITLPTPEANVLQSALEQPALIEPEACASTIWISYMSPTADSGGYPSRADVKLVQIDLE